MELEQKSIVWTSPFPKGRRRLLLWRFVVEKSRDGRVRPIQRRVQKQPH